MPARRTSYHHGDLRRALLDATLSLAAEPMRRIGAWGRCYVDFAVVHTAHFRLMFGQGSPQKSATEALQAAARDTFQLLLQTVESGARTARLRAADTRELALKIWSLAHGIAVLAIDGQTVFLGVQPERAGGVAEGAVTALLAGYARP